MSKYVGRLCNVARERTRNIIARGRIFEEILLKVIFRISAHRIRITYDFQYLLEFLLNVYVLNIPIEPRWFYKEKWITMVALFLLRSAMFREWHFAPCFLSFAQHSTGFALRATAKAIQQGGVLKKRFSNRKWSKAWNCIVGAFDLASLTEKSKFVYRAVMQCGIRFVFTLYCLNIYVDVFKFTIFV